MNIGKISEFGERILAGTDWQAIKHKIRRRRKTENNEPERR
jgi:hypothetical protein